MKAFFTPPARIAGSTLSVPRIGTSSRTKPPGARPVQPVIRYFPSARISSITTFACPPDPMMTTDSPFILFKDRPEACFGPDKYDARRRQLTHSIFRNLQPPVGSLLVCE